MLVFEGYTLLSVANKLGTVMLPESIAHLPIWAVVVDYVLGIIMYTLIARFAMGLFLPEDSEFFFSKFFVRATNPLIRLFKPITPEFLLKPLVPLYVAWFFYMIRFYVMPYVLGFGTMGMLSFQLESEFAAWLYSIVGGG